MESVCTPCLANHRRTSFAVNSGPIQWRPHHSSLETARHITLVRVGQQLTATKKLSEDRDGLHNRLPVFGRQWIASYEQGKPELAVSYTRKELVGTPLLSQRRRTPDPYVYPLTTGRPAQPVARLDREEVVAGRRE